MPNDSCGTCALCCKLPKIDQLDKPQGVWCDKCTPGKEGACSIFAQPERPAICGEYLCVWRQTDLPPALRPDRCGFIINQSETRKDVVQIMVEPSKAGIWRKGAGGALIEKLLRGGVTVVVLTGDQRTLLQPHKRIA